MGKLSFVGVVYFNITIIKLNQRDKTMTKKTQMMLGFIFALLCNVNAQPVENTLGEGLIAYWPFDGDLEDAVGNSHGTAQGSEDIAYDTGKLGQGIVLDGQDQFVQTPVENEEMFDFQDGTGFSISAWYRVDEFNKSWQALIAKGEGNRWRVHRRGGEAQLTGNGGSGDVPGATGDINDGEIHHLVLVSDPENDQVRFYSDGELVSEGGAPAIQSNDNPMMIGENPDARNRTWGGLIDDVGIWNRPITEDEIAYMYNEGEGREIVSTLGIDLAGYWPMDEGSGNVAADTTGSNDAQLYNEVEWVDDGERGSVLSFNGADAYADAGAETIPQMTQENDFTWSMWAYDRAGGNNNVVLGNRYGPEGGDFSPREFIKFTPRQFEFHYNGGGGGNVDFDDLQPDEGWFHHATVKSGNTLTYYRNGEAIDSREFDGELNNPQPLYFGGDKANENWNGMLDDVAIWTRALSAGEVNKIFGGASVTGGAGKPKPSVKLASSMSGFSVELTDDEEGSTVDAAGVSATFDGAALEVTAAKADGVTTFSYETPALLEAGTEHFVVITVKDTEGATHTLEKSFKVKPYTVVDAGSRAGDSLKGEAGIVATITQISTGQNVGNLHGNNTANAEKAFNGWGNDPETEEAYLNEADPDSFEGWSYYPVLVPVVNFDQDGGVQGSFNSNNGYDDEYIPNIPGWGDSTDGIWRVYRPFGIKEGSL
jgi:hypothetical protein